MKRLLVVVLALGAQGCFIRDLRMKGRLSPFLGEPIETAVSELGPPSTQYPNGGTTIYLWEGAYGAAAFVGTYSAFATANRCRYWLDVTPDGVVRGWHYSGPC